MERLLIANRAEIAHRIIKSANAQGLETIAVYAAVDAALPYVAAADQAVALTGETPTETYLNGEAILDAARQTGADAIHPGYGFLSENPQFAADCQAEGLLFVGPSADAIELMGQKDVAKNLVRDAGVPTVPGYQGDEQDADFLLEQAEAIGFPVLIKATSGGGGRGMRVAHSPTEFIGHVESAQREAENAFGDRRLILERFIRHARHIEVQIMADLQGTVVTLGDRDCTLQRRYQKVIEEAPAPHVAPDIRDAMAAAAVAVANAVDYTGAGTVEFIAAVDDDGEIGDFWFIEMNTRLQVEHTVTEQVTGLDLVALQLMVADGQPLPMQQNDIEIRGHALQARVYAEDPVNGFLPTSGKIYQMDWPTEARIDTGYAALSHVPVSFDNLLAKLIVTAADRAAALTDLAAALAETVVLGPRTNLGFLRRLIAHPAIKQVDYDTDFIAETADELTRPAMDIDQLGEIFLRHQAHQTLFTILQELDDRGRPAGPFDEADAFQFVGKRRISAQLVIDGVRHAAEIDWDNGQSADAVDGLMAADEGGYIGQIAGWTHRADQVPWGAGEEQGPADGAIRAPFHGRVVASSAEIGAEVAAGEVLLRLEAMKMEHPIVSRCPGVIVDVAVDVGDQVAEGDLLIEVDGDEATN